MSTSRPTGPDQRTYGRETAELREQIRIAIVRGEYAPRQRLIEAELCDRFGTSRFVLRLALQDLAGVGLVEFKRNRGARVRDVSLAEAIEMMDVRRLLEGLIAARAAERATPADAAELRRIVGGMRDALTVGDHLRYRRLNAELHGHLRKLAGHDIATQLLRQMCDRTERHGLTVAMVPGGSMARLPQHEAVVDAVEAGDPVAAEAAAHRHIESLFEDLRRTAEL